MDDAQSYLTFFGLQEQPFAPTADPAYFYAAPEHKECLFRLWSSIDGRHGIAVVLGNYGTGKTALLRKLLTGMAAAQKQYNTAVIGSPIPSWTSFALIEAVVAQFGVQPPKRSFISYIESLNGYLLANRDHVCTLIIDDAQNLNKRGQLELLRLAQNLETPQHKLLNLILFAQLEWIEVLRAAPNFEQRINMSYTLKPIPLEETRRLIEFRLRQAGADGDRAPAFDDGAVSVIHAYSEGVPRVIVTLCRNALLVASRIRKRDIGPEIILHTIDKTTVPDPEKRAQALAAARRAAAPPSVPAEPVAPAGGTWAPATREERASQLLLRAAARARQKTGEGEVPELR
jgi:type II secretory pathway predicted ATPase ExeA